jgi:hypothetical protein
MRSIVFGLALPLVCSPAPPPPTGPDVHERHRPVFQQKCGRCNRAGAMAPMPLSTFEGERP